MGFQIITFFFSNLILNCSFITQKKFNPIENCQGKEKKIGKNNYFLFIKKYIRKKIKKKEKKSARFS